MTMHILLTEGEAAEVRGMTTAHTALAPVERAGGVWILPAEVLVDLAHEEHWVFLNTLPQQDSEDVDFPAAIVQEPV